MTRMSLFDVFGDLRAFQWLVVSVCQWSMDNGQWSTVISRASACGLAPAARFVHWPRNSGTCRKFRCRPPGTGADYGAGGATIPRGIGTGRPVVGFRRRPAGTGVWKAILEFTCITPPPLQNKCETASIFWQILWRNQIYIFPRKWKGEICLHLAYFVCGSWISPMRRRETNPPYSPRSGSEASSARTSVAGRPER